MSITSKLSVADSMKRTAKFYRPEYLLALGDNFYYWGVESIFGKILFIINYAFIIINYY